MKNNCLKFKVWDKIEYFEIKTVLNALIISYILVTFNYAFKICPYYTLFLEINENYEIFKYSVNYLVIPIYIFENL